MGTTIARLALIVLLAATGFAQGSDSHSAFDAASVKLSGGDPVIPGVSHRMRGGPGTGSPGRITYTQVPLMQVLMKAWDLRDYQIAGPAWLYGVVDRTALYTIMATLPPETTKQEFQAMLQNLVVKRFRMEFHRETRKVAGFDLVVAQGGPILKESADPDAPEPTTGPPTGVGRDGFSLLPPGHGAGIVWANGMRAKFQSYTVAEFVDKYLRLFLNGSMGGDPGPIRDETGLTGKYDFTLAFDDQGGPFGSPAAQTATPPAATVPSGLPDIFNAVDKQLGLKLVRGKEIPLDVLVIAHIEKVPIEN